MTTRECKMKNGKWKMAQRSGSARRLAPPHFTFYTLHFTLLACATLFAVTASAATFHWKDNAQSTDWTDGNNYEEGSAPSAGDTVEVGDTTVKISDSDADSFSLASSLAQIKPTHKDAK